jgi:hypothetical protein
MAAATIKMLARQIAATKKRLASLLSRAHKAKAKNGKAALPSAPKRDPKQDVRHDLGKAQLSWHPWESLGSGRFARYGIGLNGSNKGAMVIVLFAERTPSHGWRWEVYPKNDYGDLLPRFTDDMVGTKPTLNEAKLAAEKVVGL